MSSLMGKYLLVTSIISHQNSRVLCLLVFAWDGNLEEEIFFKIVFSKPMKINIFLVFLSQHWPVFLKMMLVIILNNYELWWGHGWWYIFFQMPWITQWNNVISMMHLTSMWLIDRRACSKTFVGVEWNIVCSLIGNGRVFFFFFFGFFFGGGGGGCCWENWVLLAIAFWRERNHVGDWYGTKYDG